MICVSPSRPAQASSRCAPTLTIRLSRSALRRRDAIARLGATWQARRLFAFKCDELDFARSLLERRTNLWLYRTSQRAFAGDFIIVDVSSPNPAARPVLFIELKMGQPVVLSLPTSVQLRNAPAALRELAGTGVVTVEPLVRLEPPRVGALIGDRRHVLSYLGAA